MSDVIRSVTVRDRTDLKILKPNALVFNLALEYVKQYFDFNSIHSTDMEGRSLNFFSQFHDKMKGKRVTYVIDIPEDKDNRRGLTEDEYMVVEADKWLKLLATEIWLICLTRFHVSLSDQDEWVKRIIKELRYCIRFTSVADNHTHIELLDEMVNSDHAFDNNELIVVITTQAKTEYIKNLTNFVYTVDNPSKNIVMFIDKTFELPKLRTFYKPHKSTVN